MAAATTKGFENGTEISLIRWFLLSDLQSKRQKEKGIEREVEGKKAQVLVLRTYNIILMITVFFHV